jgi:hypothetical protein
MIILKNLRALSILSLGIKYLNHYISIFINLISTLLNLYLEAGVVLTDSNQLPLSIRSIVKVDNICNIIYIIIIYLR